MINVTFGAAGVTDFNAADFFFQSLRVNAGYEVTENKITLFGEDERDYVQLKGDFETDAGKNPFDYINQLSSYKFVVDGKVNYEVTGLKLTGDILGSFSKLGDYLDTNGYRVTGNAANNLISGGSAADLLNGGKGNDTLEGGAGRDTLIGGAGKDTFVFHEGDGKDQIKDFEANGKFHDTIDLSDYDKGLRFRDIDISREGRHDVLIEIGKHDEILLHDVNIKQLSVHDFSF